ncbi:hypothetical protein A2U01_0095460, partial [Trifolium medium]|nr:hypothetical protein [Trifolium medium]
MIDDYAAGTSAAE